MTSATETLLPSIVGVALFLLYHSVFVEPLASFHERYLATTFLEMPAHPLQELWLLHEDTAEVERIDEARKKVRWKEEGHYSSTVGLAYSFWSLLRSLYSSLALSARGNAIQCPLVCN